MFQASDVVVHWGEIALKGKNRPRFIDRLVENIRQALRGTGLERVRKLPGRLWLNSRPGMFFEAESLERLREVFGIATFSPMVRTENELEAIKAAAWRIVEERDYRTFRVTAHRPFKEVPLRSQDVAGALGAYLLERRPAQVRMKGADLDVRVELLPHGAFLYVDRIVGARGLPTGITGHVCAMLSGGIDSPVAVHRMQRRGCQVTFVHFHAHPFVTRASLEKAEDLAAILVRRQYEGVFYAVAFGEIQRRIVEVVAPPMRVVLYRRFMVRIAAELARRERCRALVTGEALAQVASQTLRNMTAIEEASPMSILRPLIGMDKLEIEEQARAIGTYETSILPDQDCCTLFNPENPETSAALSRVHAQEANLAVEAWVAEAVAGAERKVLRAPWWDEPPPPRVPPAP